MSNFFIVLADDFETKIIVKILKRNNKETILIKDAGRISDQASTKIEKAIQNKKELIFVGFEPEKGEWARYFGLDAPKYKIVTYKGNKNEKSIIEKIEKIIKDDILTDFERVVAAGVKDYIPGMVDEAEKLGISEKQKQKAIKNILRGSALYRGNTKKALKDAEIAINNRKEVGELTIVDYDYSNNGPIMNLLWDKYKHLLIKNKKEGTAILFTPYYDLTQVVQASGGETWTTRRENSTKYRVFSNHLAEVEGAVMRYFATR